MSDAQPTPGPWEYVASTEHHGPYITSEFGSTICDFYVMTEPGALSTASGGPSKPVHFLHEMADPNAQLLVRLANLYFAGKAASARKDAEITARGDLPADKDYGLSEAEIACAQMMNGLLEENEALASAASFLLDRLTEFERELSDNETAREFFGHVSPAIARLKDDIAKSKGAA